MATVRQELGIFGEKKGYSKLHLPEMQTKEDAYTATYQFQMR
jgi:hypothetical protein